MGILFWVMAAPVLLWLCFMAYGVLSVVFLAVKQWIQEIATVGFANATVPILRFVLGLLLLGAVGLLGLGVLVFLFSGGSGSRNLDGCGMSGWGC